MEAKFARRATWSVVFHLSGFDGHIPELTVEQRWERITDIMNGWNLKFGWYGKETCPTTGSLHAQGYVVFASEMRLTQLKKLHPWCHWDLPKNGGHRPNWEYCTKEDKNPVLIGDVPRHLSLQEREKQSWDDAYELAKQDRLEEIDKSKLTRNYFAYQQIAKKNKKRPEDIPEDKPIPHIWITGQPGSGKSSYARTLAREFLPGRHCVKDAATKWWGDYDQSENDGAGVPVIIDDADQTCLKGPGMISLYKLAMDRYSFSAELKGQEMVIRPPIVIVTSNYKIEEIFNVVDSEAMKRRVTILNMVDFKVYDKDGTFIKDTHRDRQEAEFILPETPATQATLLVLDDDDNWLENYVPLGTQSVNSQDN